MSKVSLKYSRYIIMVSFVHNVWMVWFFFFVVLALNLHLVNDVGMRVREAVYDADCHRNKRNLPRLLEIL